MASGFTFRSLADGNSAADEFATTMASMNDILACAPYQSVNECQGPATQPSAWNPICDPPYQFSRTMDPVLSFDGAGQGYFPQTTSIPPTYTNANEFLAPYASIPPTYTDARDFLQAAYNTPPAREHISPPAPTTEDLIDASFSPSMAMAMALYTNEWPEHDELSPEFAADSERHVPDMIAASSPSATPPPPDNSGPHASSGGEVEAEYGDDAYGGGNSPLFSPAPSNALELHDMEEPSLESPPHTLPTAPANDWAVPSEVQPSFDVIPSEIPASLPLPPTITNEYFVHQNRPHYASMPPYIVPHRVFGYALNVYAPATVPYSTSPSTSASPSPDMYRRHDPHPYIHRDMTPVSGLTSPNPSQSISYSWATSVAGPSNADALHARSADIQQERSGARKDKRQTRRYDPLSIHLETPDLPPTPAFKCPSIGVSPSEIKALVKIATETLHKAQGDQTITCEWNSCGRHIKHTGMATHLRDQHGVDGKTLFQCAWGSGCETSMRGDSFSKHLLSQQHLRLATLQCPTCKKSFERTCSLRRHLKKSS
ncbi:hypothetical protein C8R44DRAFT_735124 [Mycena epipterygia]|nr:hypothetical protein C8R44DRAFT_735124 [Mycena epipterygia]